ncbi:hypothetical protein BDW71DRAFT_85645 [Aspergillus fruticulosus]
MPVTDSLIATTDQTRLRHTLTPSSCLGLIQGPRWGCPLAGFLLLATFREGHRRLLPAEECPTGTVRSSMVPMVGMDSSTAINNQTTVKATIMVGVHQRTTTTARLITTVGGHQDMGRKILEAEATTAAGTKAAETITPLVATADMVDTRGSVDDVPSPGIDDLVTRVRKVGCRGSFIGSSFAFFHCFLVIGLMDGVHEPVCNLIFPVRLQEINKRCERQNVTQDCTLVRSR